MKPIHLVAGLVVGLCAARATVYVDESFDYPDGPLSEVSGGRWVTHSGTTGQVDVVSGAASLTQAESEDVSLAITNVPGAAITEGLLYAGFTVRFTALPSGAGTYFWHFRDTGTFNFRARVFATTTGAGSGKFRFGIANGGNTPVIIPTDCDLDTEYKLVVRYDVATAVATLWLNPSSEESAVNRAQGSDNTTSVPIVFVAMRQALSGGNGMGSLSLDNLRIGTEFLDVHTPGGTPTISGIPDQHLAAGTTTGPLPFEVDDVETPVDQLQVAAVSDNPLLVPNEPEHLTLSGTGKQRTLTVTPVPGREGLATIQVTVRDGQGFESSISFRVYVGEPTISSLANQVAPTNTVIGPLAFTVQDAETPNQLVVTASSSNEALVPSGNILLGGSGTQRTVRIVPAADISGTATITLTLSDGTWNIPTSFQVTFYPKFGQVLADPFDYPDGPLIESSGGFWSTHSGTTGQLQVVQGRVLLTRTQTEDVSAAFTNFLQAVGQGIVLFTSFKLNLTSLPTGANGDYFAHFRDIGTINYRGRIFVTTNGAAPGTYRVGVANGGPTPNAVLPRDLQPNTTYLVLTRYNVDTAETTLWVNPSEESSGGVTATDPTTPVTLYFFSLRESGGIGELSVDDLKIGTQWSDVWEAAAPEPERLQYSWDGQRLVSRWNQPELRLQQADEVQGPYTDVANAASPYTVPLESRARFYRLAH
ncbi:MAG: hypothetical protein WHT82_12815 [Limisphaera sp.]